MHGRHWYRHDTSQDRELHKVPSDHINNMSPHHLNRSRSPHHYSESIHYPVHNGERSDSRSHSFMKSESSPHYFERSGSPGYYQARNKSPELYLQRHRSPVHYSKVNKSPVYFLEPNQERSYSPVFHLEQGMSPVHNLERSNSPVYNFGRRSNSPANYRERNKYPAHFYEESKSNFYELKRSDSPCYYDERSNKSPPVEDLEEMSSTNHHFQRSRTPYYCPEDSDNLRNTQLSRSYLNNRRSWSPTMDLGFQSYCLERSTPFTCYSKTYEHTRTSCEETMGSSQFLNNLPDDNRLDHHSPHSQMQALKYGRHRPVRNINKYKIDSLEDMEKMTDDEINNFYLSGAAQRRVNKKVNLEGLLYTEARRVVIKENFFRDNKLPQHRVFEKSISEKSTENSTIISTHKENCSKRPSSSAQSVQTSQNLKSKKLRLEENPEDVSVVHVDYPKTSLDHDQLKLIQNAIMSAYDRLPSGGPQIRFKKCKIKMGLLLVTCADQLSADWLKKTVPQLKPWKGCLLTTLGEEEGIPKRVKCEVFVPDEHGERLSGQKIVTRLSVGNKGLNSHLWVAERKIPVDKGQLWTFVMDLECFELLKKLNMRPYFGFNALKFTLKGS